MTLSKKVSPNLHSEKKKKQLVINNHILNKYSVQTNGDIHWRCIERTSIKDLRIIIQHYKQVNQYH